MKNLILSLFMILASTIIIAVIPTEAEAAIYEDTVRLHILAPSDSTEDQNLKLTIRDKVLDKYSMLFDKCESSSVAESRISECISEIERDCAFWVNELGYDYSVKAELCEEWYNTREYKDFSLPAGYYSSLKITLGEGDGANWWCVMYPPLCLDIATVKTDTGFSEEENRLISPSGYRVKFKLLELVNEIGKHYEK